MAANRDASDAAAMERLANPNKRSRTIANLTEEQVQHKRQVDRKAQHAFRQRMKDSIISLEQENARLQEASSQRENELQQQITMLRERVRIMSQSLGNILDTTSTALGVTTSEDALTSRSEGSQNDGYGSEFRHEIESIRDRLEQNGIVAPSSGVQGLQMATSHPDEDTSRMTVTDSVVAGGAAFHLSAGIMHDERSHQEIQPRTNSMSMHVNACERAPVADPHSAGPHETLVGRGSWAFHPSPNASQSASDGHTSTTPVGHLLSLVRSSDSHLSLGGEFDGTMSEVPQNDPPVSLPTPSSTVTINRPDIPERRPESSPSPTIFTVTPPFTSPVCPLDDILLNFMNSRRAMIANGEPVQDVIGPQRPTLRKLLNPKTGDPTHALAGLIGEILSKYLTTKMAEKMTFFWVMSQTMRWLISRDKKDYLYMPPWLRPTAIQMTVPHAIWITNIPWPGVRDMLIEEPERYPYEVVGKYYTEHVTVNWGFDSLDAVEDANGDERIHSIFEKHLRNLKNWTVSPTFLEGFPAMASAIYGT